MTPCLRQDVKIPELTQLTNQPPGFFAVVVLWKTTCGASDTCDATIYHVVTFQQEPFSALQSAHACLHSDTTCTWCDRLHPPAARAPDIYHPEHALPQWHRGHREKIMSQKRLPAALQTTCRLLLFKIFFKNEEREKEKKAWPVRSSTHTRTHARTHIHTPLTHTRTHTHTHLTHDSEDPMMCCKNGVHGQFRLATTMELVSSQSQRPTITSHARTHTRLEHLTINYGFQNIREDRLTPPLQSTKQPPHPHPPPKKKRTRNRA